jgi:hypothetical protein
MCQGKREARRKYKKATEEAKNIFKRIERKKQWK